MYCHPATCYWNDLAAVVQEHGGIFIGTQSLALASDAAFGTQTDMAFSHHKLMFATQVI